MNIIANQPRRDDPGNDQKHYHFNCGHCRWNSLHIDFKGETLNQLLMKFNFYKGKYQRSPQQLQFEKLFEIYKFNQDEHIKFEKFVLRSKKKTISYLNMQSNKRRPKYLKSHYWADEKKREDKLLETDKKLMTFEEIYQMKLEMEALEKNRQSQYDGKS